MQTRDFTQAVLDAIAHYLEETNPEKTTFAGHFFAFMKGHGKAGRMAAVKILDKINDCVSDEDVLAVVLSDVCPTDIGEALAGPTLSREILDELIHSFGIPDEIVNAAVNKYKTDSIGGQMNQFGTTIPDHTCELEGRRIVVAAKIHELYPDIASNLSASSPTFPRPVNHAGYEQY